MIGLVLWMALQGQGSANPISTPLGHWHCVFVNGECKIATDDLWIGGVDEDWQGGVGHAGPSDVPAIQRKALVKSRAEICDHIDSSLPESKAYCESVQKYWTCSDTSRILLTSEDGVKHCIKF